ncbi:hypothetical protein GMSM_20280 [Geomonas sp. Red276]
MRRMTIFLALVFCCTLCAAVQAQRPDPLAELKRFGDFPRIDTKRLLEGEILTQRGPLMKFPNGISSQLCFAVPLSPAETVKQLQSWDSKRYAALKVYVSQDLSDPVAPDAFNSLSLYLDLRNAPVRWLLDQTLATTARHSDLNLTQI